MANIWDNMTAQNHVVAESSLIKAVTTGHILSLKAIADTDNGSIVCRGDWDSSTPAGQVFKAKAYVAGSKPYLVLTTPVGYNTDKKYYTEEKWFYNAKNEIMRAYELNDDDIFTVSDNAITKASGNTEPKVGNYVTITDGLYTETTTKPTSGIVLQIIDKVNYTYSTSYRIHVVSTGA